MKSALLKRFTTESRAFKVSAFVHVDSTPVGGGVAEILRSLIPISKGLGIDTDWYYITPPKEFFDVSKKIHNLMQGAEDALSHKERQIYITYADQGANLDLAPIGAAFVVASCCPGCCATTSRPARKPMTSAQPVEWPSTA